MSILEKIGLDIIGTEVRWLAAIRSGAEAWFNELTDPILPVLLGDITASKSSKKKRMELAKVAKSLHSEHCKVNNGDKVANTLAEMSKSFGIPFVSGRRSLRPLVKNYLEAGDFLKSIAYTGRFDGDDTKKIKEAINEMKSKWKAFQQARLDLVDQLNSQIAAIGSATDT